MMNKMFMGLIGLAVFAGCTKNDAQVTGTLSNTDGETIILERVSSSETVAIDSVTLGSDGSFKLNTGDVTGPGFYRLRVGDNNFIILLLEKGDDAVVTGNVLDLYRSYEITGSQGSTELRELDKVLRGSYEQTDSLRKVFQAHQMAGHPRLDSIMQSIDAVYQQLQAEKRDFVHKFLAEHKNSLVCISAVQALNPMEDFDKFEEVADNLSVALPESEYVKQFKLQLTDMKNKQQAAARTNVGSQAPELVLQTPEGNTVKLSDFRGKVTLIDFWASWCKPCRMENPNVVKVYNRFKDKGFEIFGVSLDQGKDQWLEAIKTDGLIWKHGSELQYWQSSFVGTYNLDGIPMTYLVDENGVIIAKGLRGAELEQKLEEIFQ
jgi:thiol-disulfide isomerase/thioredoxin